MSIPRQIRSVFKLGAAAALGAAVVVVVAVVGLHRRAARIQNLYESVAIGDAWSGLDGFMKRPVVRAPNSRVPAEAHYHRRITFLRPTCWEIVVDDAGRVAAKFRYD